MPNIVLSTILTGVLAFAPPAGGRAPGGDEGLILRVVVAGGPHAGRYEGRSSTPCVDTPDGFVVGYMPAVVERGLRSFRLVLAEPDAAGSEAFTLNLSLAESHRVVASYAIDPRSGVGSGTARLSRTGSAAVVQLAGTTAQGVRVEVNVRCPGDADAAVIADAEQEEERDAAEAADTLPDQVVDSKVTEVAGRMALGGAIGKAALHEAIQWSGLAVRSDEGEMVLAPLTTSQGVAFDAEDLAMMERSLGTELTVPLGELTRAMAKARPGLTGSVLARELVAALRQHATGRQPALRFWARFIAAAGGDGRAAYAGTPDSLQLNPVQLAFVLRRLQADLLARKRRAEGKLSSTQRGVTPSFGFAAADAWRVAHRGGPSVMDWPVMDWPVAERARSPIALETCKLSDEQGVALDWGAVVITNAFGKFAEHVGGAVAAVGSVTSAASFALSMLKSVGLLATLKIESELEGGSPLVRTHSAREDGEGERRVVTRLTLPKTDALKTLNCLRPLFNQAGLDFSIPDGGPVKDAGVSYHFVEGDTRVLRAPGKKPQRAILNFAPGNSGEFHVLKTRTRHITDDNGGTSVRIVGLRQEREVPSGARPQEKPGALRVNVQLTRASLFKDLPSVVGTALTFSFAPIAAIPELLSRMHVPLATTEFAVRDWTNDLMVELTASGLHWGVGPCEQSDGTDVISGTMPDSAGEGPVEFIRTSSAPLCGGKPVPKRCDPKKQRCRQAIWWDGDDKVCVLRLNGVQQVRFTMRVETDHTGRELMKLSWQLAGRDAGNAAAVGDCLDSRWGHEFEPDNEFITFTKEELVAEYEGYDLGLHQRTRRWKGSGGGATFVLPPNLKRPFRLQSLEPAGENGDGDSVYWTLEVR